jgi:EAL domain-containing protein (putative c-di-GMP-specific phosphodiesterase class I)/ActR/RegA family two-component response regulator
MDPPSKPCPSTFVASNRPAVLVVDDEPVTAKGYASALLDRGFRVSAASDAETALGMLEAGTFECIVADIVMPGLDGLELLHQVRERNLDLPVILTTGYPGVDSAARAVEYGAFRYFVKPIALEQLAEAAGQAAWLCHMARLRRQAHAYLQHAGLPARDRALLDVRFEHALALLWMAFQPIVLWSERRVVAYEALVRSASADFSEPGMLLDAAERLGRLDDLGRAIRGSVAEVVRKVPRQVDFFVNLHSHDLLDDSLYSRASPLSAMASRVVLEVTERASLDAIPDVRQRVARLRSLGFRIAVDDLGAGYAGLNSFAQLQPEFVKLDIALVRDIHLEPTKRALAESMANLCRQMHVSVVAEGVECEGERDALLAAGCGLFQGFLFGKPERRPSEVPGCQGGPDGY